MTAAGVPARLEPPGLLCSDGKQPEAVSVIPWKSRKFLVSNATCVNTFAPFYMTLAAHEEGADAARAES